jgi:hypothetical protein
VNVNAPQWEQHSCSRAADCGDLPAGPLRVLIIVISGSDGGESHEMQCMLFDECGRKGGVVDTGNVKPWAVFSATTRDQRTPQRDAYISLQRCSTIIFHMVDVVKPSQVTLEGGSTQTSTTLNGNKV